MGATPVVKVAKTDPAARMPTKGSAHAAGWDLYCLEDTVVNFRSSMKLRTGLRVAIPEGFEGQVRARSSLGSKGLILPHSIGTIDADYRGDVGVILINHGKAPFVIEDGERIAQLVIARYVQLEWKPTDDLSETDRGAGGFGSTGVK